MTRLSVLASSFFFCAVGACSDGSGNVDGIIDYDVTGGISGTTAEVHVEGDGTVTVRRYDNTTDTNVLAPSLFDDLKQQVEAAQFPTLEPKYGCGGCADDVVHTISVDIDGRTYTVQADDSADHPERLKTLIGSVQLFLVVALPADTGSERP
jgi:hypothetical protein